MRHIDALELRLSRERDYLRSAKTDQEKQLRQVWIDQLHKEISIEKATFSEDDDDVAMSDDEILSALFDEEK